MVHAGQPPTAARRGFTLIELLVVIAIIAVLAAILFPIFTKAQQKAFQATCMSNQRQLAVILLMTTQDNDDSFPDNDNIGATIRSNVKLSSCPSLPGTLGYIWNYRIADKSTGTAALLNGSVADTTNVFLTADGLPAEQSAPKNRIYVHQFDRRHSGKVVASFLDGHVGIADRKIINGWLPEESFSGELKIYGTIAGLQEVIDNYIADYQAEFGRTISFTIDSAGNQMARVNRIRTQRDGDIFIPADDSFIGMLNAEGLCHSNAWHLQPQYVRLVASSTVEAANLNELLTKVNNGEIVMGMGDPASGYVAILTRKYVEKLGLSWKTFSSLPNVKTYGTLGQVQTNLKNGNIQAAILWETMALTLASEATLKIIPDDALDKEVSYVAVAPLMVKEHQFEAMRFARYLGSKDKGLPILKRNGVKIVPIAELWGGFD